MKNRKIIKLLTLALAAMLMGSACASGETGGEEAAYTRISQEEARTMMESGEACTIVDVRTQAEYNEGHISGAICIPNETIDKEKPAELTDTDRVLLVYCRSGRRSEEAARKLAALGYTRVYDFGGIMSWTGEVVTND